MEDDDDGCKFTVEYFKQELKYDKSEWELFIGCAQPTMVEPLDEARTKGKKVNGRYG